ncbi:MAG: MMPL family transporter [Myxococcota bacterium]
MEAWSFSAGTGAFFLGALLLVARRPHWIVEWPRLVLLLTAGISAVAVAVLVSFPPPAFNLQLDPSSEPLLPANDPAREAYHLAVKEFGDDEIYVIALESDEIFTHEGLQALRRVSDEISRMAGVRNVKSLVDVVSFRYDAERDWIDVGPFIDEIPTDPSEIDALRQRAVTDPLYERSLVSPDGRAVAINVSFHKMTDRAFIEADFDRRIQRILVGEERNGRHFYVAGRPHMKSRVYRMMIDDLRRLIPAVAAVIALILFALTGDLRMVALPMGSVLVSTLWTFAGVSALDRPLTVLTMLLAPTLIAIGSAYGVHVLSRFDEEVRAGGEPQEAVLRCLEAMVAPVLISGVTTGIGFAALMITDVPAVFELGAFSILGVLSLTLLSLTAVPAALMVIPGRIAPELHGFPGRVSARALRATLDGLARLAVRSPNAVLGAWVLVTIAALVAIPRIVIDTDYLSYFDPRSEVRRDFAAVNRLLSGAIPIFIVLTGSGRGAFREPQALLAMERIQNRLEEAPGVSRTHSMVDFLRVLNRVVSEGDPAAEHVPDTRSGVADLISLIPKHDLGRFSNVNQSRANILVRTGEIGSAAIRRLVDRIEAVIADEPLPREVRAEITGNAILLSRSADGIAAGQPRTVGAAAVAILFLVSGALGSTRLGLVAMIPNGVPVLLFFGALGWGVAPLSLPTSLIASIALGISIDATAHYLVRYRAERLAGHEPAAAVLLTHRSVGPPIAIASLTLFFGFAVVAFSEFATLRQFGLLTAVTLAVCAATDLLLLPAVLVRSRL